MANKQLTKEQFASKVNNSMAIGSSIGLMVGLGYAFAKKKKFWGYVGFSLLGSLMLGTGCAVVANVANKGKLVETPKV